MNSRPTLDSPDAEIIDFVSSWIHCLIEQGYENAIALLDDPIESDRHKWTKEEWDRELEVYGEEALVTQPSEVPDLRMDVYRYTDRSGFAVDFDLPINGARSDHTLQFDFRIVEDGMHVALDDLHVL